MTSSDEEDATENMSRIKSDVECPVCLQIAVHPTKLPCGHIFCYLCLKGVVTISHRCALCRRETSKESIEHPELVFGVESVKNIKPLEDGYQWFYEGRNGWWQYDERTSNEIESAYKAANKTCAIFVAGFIYVVDFETMMQRRQNDPSKKRCVKRDLAVVPKKGIAGIRLEDSGTSAANIPMVTSTSTTATSPPPAILSLSTNFPSPTSSASPPSPPSPSPPSIPTSSSPSTSSSNSFFQYNPNIIPIIRGHPISRIRNLSGNSISVPNQPSGSGLNNIYVYNPSVNPTIKQTSSSNGSNTSNVPSNQNDPNDSDNDINSDALARTLERFRRLSLQATVHTISDDSDSDHV